MIGFGKKELIGLRLTFTRSNMNRLYINLRVKCRAFTNKNMWLLIGTSHLTTISQFAIKYYVAWYLCGWKQWGLDEEYNQKDFPCS